MVLSDFDQDGRGSLVRSPMPQGERGHVGGGEVGLKALPFPPHWRMPAGGHCWPGYCTLNRLQVVLSAASSLLPAPGRLHVCQGPQLPATPPTPGHALPRLYLEPHSSCCLWTLIRRAWPSHPSSIVSSPCFPTAPQLPCPPLLLPICLRMITAHFHRMSRCSTTLWSGSNIIPISQVRKPRSGMLMNLPW